MKKVQSKILILLVLGLILLGINALDPTLTWKTYTNTKYAYSVKYPPKYTPKLDIRLKPEPLTGEEHLIYFHTIPLRQESLGIEVQKGNCRLEIFNADKSIPKRQAIILNNVNGTIWTEIPPDYQPFYGNILVNVNYNSKCYMLTFFNYTSDIKKSEATFRQILSTFRLE